MKQCLWVGVFAALITSFTARSNAAVLVNLELSLLLDVSASVNNTEFNLQRTGYVNAFNNPSVQALISNTLTNPGGIAVNLVYWSGASDQLQAVPWTLIQNATDAANFATAVNSAARPFSDNTAPGSAINFAAPLFTSNNFDSNYQVIDVSGDGAENEGAITATARNNALAAGIDRINGLPILGEAGLLTFYQNNIQGGVGSFTTPAASFADFNSAILQKLTFEIGNPSGQVPEPSSAAIWCVLGLATGASRFRRKPRN